MATSFAPSEQQVRDLMCKTWSMPATVLVEWVGWTGTASWLRENVAAIRPEYARRSGADRIVYHPGDQAQWDLWFPEPTVPVADQ